MIKGGGKFDTKILDNCEKKNINNIISKNINKNENDDVSINLNLHFQIINKLFLIQKNLDNKKIYNNDNNKVYYNILKILTRFKKYLNLEYVEIIKINADLNDRIKKLNKNLKRLKKRNQNLLNKNENNLIYTKHYNNILDNTIQNKDFILNLFKLSERELKSCFLN